MNGFQRTVKYVAMALGLCLALSIILAIAGGVSALFGVVGWWQEGEMGTCLLYTSFSCSAPDG